MHKRIERIFSIVLAVIMCFSLLPVSVAAAGNTDTHWAQSDFDKLVKAEVLTGFPDGSMRPDNNMSRAEFVAVINRTFGYTDRSGQQFADIKGDEWYANQVLIARTAGYFSGIGNNRAGAETLITKEQVATILQRIYNFDMGNGLSSINDASQISEFARDAVSALISKGIIQGDSAKNFSPLKSVTRAEVVTMVSKTVGEIIRDTAVKDRDIIGNVLLTNPNVVLENVTISGDLFISKAAATGKIDFVNTSVSERVIAEGGISVSTDNKSNIAELVAREEIVYTDATGKTAVIGRGQSIEIKGGKIPSAPVGGGTGSTPTQPETVKNDILSTIVVKAAGATNVMTVGTSAITVTPGTTEAQLLGQIKARDDVTLDFSVVDNSEDTVTGTLSDGDVLNVSLRGKDYSSSYKIELYNQAEIDEWGDYWDDPMYRSIDDEVNRNIPTFKDADYVITDEKYAGLVQEDYVEYYSTGKANGVLDSQIIPFHGKVIQAAIDEASANGGGRVVLPAAAGEAETVYYTAALWLKSNVNLYIEEGVTLKFVRNIDNENYPLRLTQFEGSDLYTYSPFIYSLNEKNVAITGKGTVDGQADAYNWWNWKRSSSSSNAPGQRPGNYNMQANLLTGGYAAGGELIDGVALKAGDKIPGHNIDQVPVTERIYTWDGQRAPAGTKIPTVELVGGKWVTNWIDIPENARIGWAHTTPHNPPSGTAKDYSVVENTPSMLRPCFIEPYLTENVLIEGITINNSPMWEIHPKLSTNILVRDVTIESYGNNNDGVDPDSCKNVVIEDTIIDTGDDCIAIKSGKNEDGRRWDTYSENIIIRRVNFREGHGGITIGSECAGAARYIFSTDNHYNSANLDQVIRFKTNSKRSDKAIEKMYHKDSTVNKVSGNIINAITNYSAGGIDQGDYGAFVPVIKDLYLYNFTTSGDTLVPGNSSPKLFTFNAYARAPISGVYLKNCVFRGVSNSSIDNIKDLVLEDVILTPKANPTPDPEDLSAYTYHTTPVEISDVKISDGENSYALDESKEFAQQLVASNTVTITGKFIGGNSMLNSKVTVTTDRGPATGSNPGQTGTAVTVTLNGDGTFAANVTLTEDPFSADTANHFISIAGYNDVATLLPKGNQTVKVYKVRIAQGGYELKFADSHPNVTAIDNTTKKITVMSGAKVNDLIGQVELITSGTATFKVTDWLGEEKVPASNFDMLTTGDILVVTLADETAGKYTIEVPGAAPYWDATTYNSILTEVKANLPTFKSDVFDITDAKYTSLIRKATISGAEVDDYTLVFRKAIEDCTQNGGGIVLVPARADAYRTGAIWLDNNVNLHIEENATIDFLPINATGAGITPEDLFPRTIMSYEGIDFFGYSPPVHAHQKSGFAITGGGTIVYSDIGGWGGAVDDTIREWNFANLAVEERDAFSLGQKINPPLVQIYDCDNFIVSGVTLGNSAFWSMNLILCENALVRGVNFISTSSNSDGCNPESSRNIIIENNRFANKDDNIALKSGRANNGKLRNKATERVIIRGNEHYQGSGISVGSEAAGGVKNIFVENNFWNGRRDQFSGNANENLLRSVFRIKNANSLNATFENIYFRNCPIGGLRENIFFIERTADNEFVYSTGAIYGALNNTPAIRNIAMSNLFTVANRVDGKVDSMFQGAFFESETQDLCPVNGIYMKDIDLVSSGINQDYKYILVNNAINIQMSNVHMNDKVYNTENSIKLTNVKANDTTLGSNTTAVTSAGSDGTIVVTGIVETDIADFETVGSVRVSYDVDNYLIKENNQFLEKNAHWVSAALSKESDGKVHFMATLVGVGADIHDLAVVAKSNKLPHYVANDNKNARGTADMVYCAANAYRIDVEGTLRAMKVTYEYAPSLTPFHNVPILLIGDSVTVKVNIVDAKTGAPVVGATLTMPSTSGSCGLTVNPYTAQDGYTFKIMGQGSAATNRAHIVMGITCTGYADFVHSFRRVTVVKDLAELAKIIPAAYLTDTYFPLLGTDAQPEEELVAEEDVVAEETEIVEDADVSEETEVVENVEVVEETDVSVEHVDVPRG